LAESSIVTVLPNIYNEEQLKEFAQAAETPDLTTEELKQINELYKNQFYITPYEETAKR
jgi:aryl-alcohol dehydrogenase-like predicted oxidoreductase